MIYLQLSGRCGNQLFQYAAARQLQTLTGQPLTLETHILGQYGSANDLAEFQIAPCDCLSLPDTALHCKGSALQKLAAKAFAARMRWPAPATRQAHFDREAALQPGLNRFGIYKLNHSFSPLRPAGASDLFLEGNFEDSRIFAGVRGQLLRELTPKAPSPAANDALYTHIRNSESVCVSIRRGDFFSGNTAKERSLCDKAYFEQAIRLMLEKHPDSTLFFFSDDVAWAREAFADLPCPCDFESGNDTVSEKLRLMRACKHFILSNSTFSWWAQYLGEAPDKTVISPSRWRNRNDYTSPLLQPDWLLIEV